MLRHLSNRTSLTAAPDLVGEDLACRRGELVVFVGASFRLSPGGALILSGANGSGKSSLLRLVAGLLTPAAGRLLWGTTPVTADLASHHARLHYIGHQDALKPAMTPREVLAFAAALRGRRLASAEPALDKALAAFDLEGIADWPCRWLSAGQRRRVALARLLASPAPLWLLDEPTTALDSDSQARLEQAIATHRSKGGMAMIATHAPIQLDAATTLALDSLVPPLELDPDLGRVIVAAFLALFRRDLRLALRQGGDTGLVVAFFVLTVVLFPFGVGPEPEVLARSAPGILWVAALLAALLSLDRLFLPDYEDGSLDLIALSPLPLELAALAKSTAHWVSTGVPLALISPALALIVDLDPRAIATLLASLLIGTPALSLIGGVAAALTLGARRQGVLLSLLVLPLYVPPLIFGAGAVEAAAFGAGPRADLLLLGALTLAALPLCPWAAAAALRQALE